MIADRASWLTAHEELLGAEKAHMRAGDALAARRRALPKVRVEKPYCFTDANGEVSLADLFGPHSQLVVYHFIFGTDWPEGCPSCSFWADKLDGIDVHLAARDTAFACVSKAPLEKLEAYQKRMDWRFRWVSAAGTSFNEDFHGCFTPEEIATKSNVYNYRKGNFNRSQAPCLNVFERLEDGTVLHTDSTYGRGLEAFNGAYHILDLTPKGRDDDGLEYAQA